MTSEQVSRTVDSTVPSSPSDATSNRQQRWVRFEFAGWVGSAAIALGVVVVVERPDTYFWWYLSNAMHVVMSGALALAVLRVARLWPNLRSSPHLRVDASTRPVADYVVAALVVFGVGVAIELTQTLTRGTPNIKDVVYNMLGALGTIAIALSIDRRLTPSGRPIVAWLLRFAALVLVGLGLASPARAAQNLILHARSFPVLFAFEHSWERVFIKTGVGEKLEFVDPPSGFDRAQGKVAKMVFLNTGERRPRLKLIDLVRDWESYDSFDFEVWAPPDTEPLQMTLSFHDDGPLEYEAHFNQVLDIKPGPNTFSIPMEFIRTGASNRPMRLNKIENLILFMEPPPRPITLYFDSFRLSKK